MLSQLGQFVRLKPPELKKEEPDMRIGAFLNQGIVCKITRHFENLLLHVAFYKYVVGLVGRGILKQAQMI